MSVKKINGEDFQAEVLDSSVPVVVDFNAQWCGPCRMLEPILEKAAAQLAPAIKICAIDTDENPEIAGKYGITGIPCLIIFKNGSEAHRIVGVKQEAELISEIKGSV